MSRKRERRTQAACQRERSATSNSAAIVVYGCVYGVRKVWCCAVRAATSRCTVARLMREMGLQGAVRGRRFKTEAGFERRFLERDFNATRPNELWVSDGWRGFVYVAFVIDVFARLIVGWRATTAGIALEAGAARAPTKPRRYIGASQRLLQYVSIRYTERLAEAGIELSAAEATPITLWLNPSYRGDPSTRALRTSSSPPSSGCIGTTTLGADRKCRPRRVR